MFEKHGIILFLIDNFSVSMLQCVMPLQTPFKWVFLRHRGTPSPTPGNSAFPGAGKQKKRIAYIITENQLIQICSYFSAVKLQSLFFSSHS